MESSKTEVGTAFANYRADPCRCGERQREVSKFPSSQRRSTRADQMAEGGQEVSKNLAIDLVLKTPQHRD